MIVLSIQSHAGKTFIEYLPWPPFTADPGARFEQASKVSSKHVTLSCFCRLCVAENRASFGEISHDACEESLFKTPPDGFEPSTDCLEGKKISSRAKRFCGYDWGLGAEVDLDVLERDGSGAVVTS